MTKPYVICHMVTSLDGKVTGEFLSSDNCIKATEVYYEINRAYKADAFACGRITMEGSFTGGFYPALAKYAGIRMPHEDYVADPSADFFAVAFDRRGRLGWKTARIEDDDPGYGNAHIIEVLCEDTPDAYLAYLREIGVSYIFAGDADTDIPVAVEKLHRLFGIKTLLLEGGSILNGAFAAADLIDEISLVMAPTIGDSEDKPLFMESTAAPFTLTKTETRDGVVILNYTRNPKNNK